MDAKGRLIEIFNRDGRFAGREELADIILKEFWHISENKYVYIPIDGKESFEKVAKDWAKMNGYIPISKSPEHCEVANLNECVSGVQLYVKLKPEFEDTNEA